MVGQQHRITRCKESCDYLDVRVRQTSTRYIDEFIRLKCAPDLLELEVFPDAKEVSEAMAVWAGVRKWVPGFNGNGYKGYTFLDIGSGVQPRFGVLACMLSAAQAISIDPRLRPFTGNVKRLYTFRGTAGEFASNHKLESADGIPVACLVHSHAPVEEVLDCFHGRAGWIVALPCCVPFNHQVKRDDVRLRVVTEYHDWGVFSPHRRIIVCEVLPRGGS